MNNNQHEYYEENYGIGGQSHQMSTKKSQQTSSNNGTESNDVSTSDSINGGGPKEQRATKQHTNGVK